MRLARENLRPRQIVWPRTPQGFRALLLGDAVVGTWTHFDHTAFKSCLCAQHAECVFCRQGWLVRWKGFVPALIALGQEVIVELSELAAIQVLKACGPDLTPRGLDLHFRREDRRQNSAVIVEVYQRLEASSVPPAFDPVDAVIKLFGLKATPWAACPKDLFRPYYRVEELSQGPRKEGES